jgi:large subunit GTPase 1
VKYASEQTPSKPMMLILNKADFLSERQRLVWAQYLSDVGIKFVFYSARREQQK